MKYTNITGHGMALNVSHENIVDLEVSINTAKKSIALTKLFVLSIEKTITCRYFTLSEGRFLVSHRCYTFQCIYQFTHGATRVGHKSLRVYINS